MGENPTIAYRVKQKL